MKVSSEVAMENRSRKGRGHHPLTSANFRMWKKVEVRSSETTPLSSAASVKLAANPASPPPPPDTHRSRIFH